MTASAGRRPTASCMGRGLQRTLNLGTHCHKRKIKDANPDFERGGRLSILLGA